MILWGMSEDCFSLGKYVGVKKGLFTIAIVFALLGGSRLASAAVTACGAAPGDTLSSLAGAGTNIPIDGCGAINVGFSNFTVPASGSETAPPTATTIEVQASGTAPAAVDGEFTSIGSGTTGWGILTALNTHTQTTDLDFAVSTNLDPAFAPPGGKVWALNGAAALSLVNPVIDITTGTDPIPVGTEILITETLCLNTNALAGCTAADEVQVSVKYSNDGHLTNTTGITTLSSSCLSTTAFGCIVGTGAQLGTLSFNNVSQLYIEDVVTLQNPTTLPTTTDRYTISLNSFNFGFDQDTSSPEPASFGLMAAALAGLALFKYRSRKSA